MSNHLHTASSTCIFGANGKPTSCNTGPPYTMTFYPSPLKQFKSGVALKDITCASNLQLVIKAESRSPACIKPDDVSKLVERGWAKDIPLQHP